MKNIIVLIIIFVLPLSSIAQINGHSSDLQELNTRYLIDKSLRTDYEMIKGSPFLDKDFSIGTINFKKGNPVKAAIRYNIYTDKFEYTQNNKVYEIINDSEISSIILGQKVFISLYQAYYGTNNGYYQVIFKSPEESLLKKYSVKLHEKEEEKPIVGSKPARFSRESDTYFFKEDEKLSPFKLKKSYFYKKYPNYKDQLKNYVKENKLSYKSEEDVEKILTYLNSIEIN